MKSREVYAVLASHLGPAFQAAGFKRTRTMLSWLRPQQANYLVVWCQVSQDGWDEYVGSKFTVEFQLSYEPVVGVHHRHRQRLSTMLTCEEREELRTIQNAVISSLRHPPTDHPILELDATRKWYPEVVPGSGTWRNFAPSINPIAIVTTFGFGMRARPT